MIGLISIVVLLLFHHFRHHVVECDMSGVGGTREGGMSDADGCVHKKATKGLNIGK